MVNKEVTPPERRQARLPEPGSVLVAEIPTHRIICPSSGATASIILKLTSCPITRTSTSSCRSLKRSRSTTTSKAMKPGATKATELLRVWFLNPATRMNPHLKYAQAILGLNEGRGIGIIETRGLPRLIDAIGLLSGSKAWTKADQQGVVTWFEKYLQWLLESKPGRDEAAAKNNHGTFYDVQVASLACFVGQREVATKILRASMQKRIAAQVELDGRQPLELDRTRGWGYSLMNLRGLFELAALGESAELDLWNYKNVGWAQSSPGARLARALRHR